MDAVQLGPFAIPTQVALLVTSILLAHAVAAWFRTSRGLDPGPILWKMILIGFGVARLIFVLRHHDLYFNPSISIIDLRDGGFDDLAGLATACVVGIELTRRSTALRRPLVVATLAGCTMFVGGTSLNLALTPADAPVPAIDVRRLDGSAVSLSKFVGRPLIINLWATWCPPCRREMPALNSARQAHPEVEFVFVNQGESVKTVESYLAAYGLQMPNIVVDPAKQLSTRTGAAGYPTTLFYDAKGRLYLRHTGELSRATLDEKINRLLEVR